MYQGRLIFSYFYVKLFSLALKFTNLSRILALQENPEAEAKSAKQILKQVLRSKILLVRVVNCSFCW
jgi:hypothetical protein